MTLCSTVLLQSVLALVLVGPALMSHMLEVNEFCDEEMTVCTCPEEYDECPFQLVIQRLVTFTRYVHNSPAGTRGKLFFINDSGVPQHIPFLPDTTGCQENDCTPINTVDGATYRTFISINGRIPGPTLVVYEGQIMVVDVINQLHNEVTTVHWHGIKQFNTPWMDGAGIISQCPLSPGTSFRYIFRANEAGTFWYHSHSSPQRLEGAFGALVVKERQVEYPIEHEDDPEKHTLTLLDWQREVSISLFWKFKSSLLLLQQEDDCTTTVPDPLSSLSAPTFGNDGTGLALFSYWSGLINGLGKHRSVAYKNSRLNIFEVQEGVTYRFRLVGAQAQYAYRFSVDNHRLTIVATDGYKIEPVVADYVIVHSGERYDFLLTANSTNQSSYWMRAETLEADLSQSLPPYPFVADRDARAILHYLGTPLPTPPQYENISYAEYYPKTCTQDSPCVAVNCPFQDFHPSYNITCVNVHQLRLIYPTAPYLVPSVDYDEQYFLNFGFHRLWQTGIVNGLTFLPPTVSFHAMPDRIDTNTFCDLHDTCDGGCFCTHVLDIPYNKTIRLVFTNRDSLLAHPIHFHGHAFQVLATGYGTYDENTGRLVAPSPEVSCLDASCSQTSWTNVTGPSLGVDEFTVRKDTVILPAGGYVVVHFVSNNPGYWPLHCHFEFHQRAGMGLVLNIAQSRHNPAPKGMETCGNFSWTVEEYINATQFDPEAQTTDMPTETTVEQREIVCEDSDELSTEAVAAISVAGDVFTVLAIVIAMAVFYLLQRRRAVLTRNAKDAFELAEGANTIVNPTPS